MNNKKLSMKLLSVMLALAMMIQLIPATVYASTIRGNTEVAEEEIAEIADADVPEGETNAELMSGAEILEELTDRRTEYSKEYLLSNGLHLVALYGEAVHYDRDGRWEDIDNTLQSTGTEADGTYTNTVGSIQVSIPRKFSEDKGVCIARDGKSVSFYMTGAVREITVSTASAQALPLEEAGEFTDQLSKFSSYREVLRPLETDAGKEDTGIQKMKEQAEHGEIVQEKLYSRVRYPEVYGNTDVVYDLVSDQIKESIVLKRYDKTISGYAYILTTNGLIPELLSDGSILLKDVEGNLVMEMPAPYLVDDAGELSYDVEVTLEPTENGYILTYHLPKQWLSMEERKWPVVLDPSVTTDVDRGNIEDQTVYSASHRANVVDTESPGILQCGYRTNWGRSRSFLRYNTLPEITSEKVILQASVALFKAQNGSCVVPVEVRKVLNNWDETTLTWNNQPAASSVAEDYAIATTAGWYYWDVTDIARSWYNGSNYGMMFRLCDAAEEEENTNSYKQFYSSDYGLSYRPIMRIVFRDGNGLENYWNYTNVSAGRGGTGYINNYTGTLTWVKEVMGFGGSRMPVSLRHIYNSSESSTNRFGMGRGWRTNFNQLVYTWEADPSYYIWEDGDGTKHYLKKSTENTYKDEDGLEITLTTGGSGSSTYILTDKDENKSYFDSYGRLVKMENNQKQKSSITITYTTNTGKYINTVTDGVGRKYTYSYSGSMVTKLLYYGKGNTDLTHVNFYSAGDMIMQISDRDGEKCIFGYNNYFLTSVRDVQDDVIAFTYSNYTTGRQNKVIHVKETSGNITGGTLDLEYAHNQTTLKDAHGNVEILQFNNFGNVISVQDDEGRAQYSAYAINNDKEKENAGENQKVNQLMLSSKLQNTVANAIIDNSFERGSTWYEIDDSVTWSMAADSYIGKQCLKLVRQTAGTASGVYCRNIDVTPGRTITFSAYIKTDSTAYLQIYDKAAGIVVSGEKVDASLSSYEDWTRVQVSYTPESSTYIVPRFMTEDAGTTYIDCIQIEYATTASRFNLLKNGDFHYPVAAAYGWYLSGGSNSASVTVADLGDDVAAPQLQGKVLSITGDPTTTKYVQQDVRITGNKGDCFVVAGWAKGDSVPFKSLNENATERKFSLQVLFLKNGAAVSSDSAVFNPDTDSSVNWQYAAKPVIAGGDYDQVRVIIHYDYNLNTVYFDGLQLYREQFGTSYTYDKDGNVTAVQSLTGSNTLYSYSTKGDLLSVTEQAGDNSYVTAYEYDNWHNITSATTSTGSVFAFAYDDYGNNTSVSVTENGITMESTVEYTADKNYPASTTNGAGETTTYVYNGDTGVLESVTGPKDSASTKTIYIYDCMYRAAAVVKNLGEEQSLGVSYRYDGDRLSGITTGSTSYGFTYGPFGLTESISVGGQTLAEYNYSEDYLYLTSVDYGNGDSVEYTVDEDGRVTAKTYEDNDTVTYEYDNDGALSVMKDSASGTTTRYFYDLSGRLSKYTESTGTDVHSVAYVYNERNQLSKLDETIGGSLRRGNFYYDKDGRITQVYNEHAHLFRNYTYDGFGLTTERYTHSYGNRLLREYFTYRNPTASTITGQVAQHRFEATNYNAAYTYTYDENGNITSISDGSHTTTYVYDTADQLIRENNEKGGFTYIWTYDNAGNILKREEYDYTTGTVGTPRFTAEYSYGNADNKDILTAYDGDVIIRDEIGNPLSDGAWNYVWEHGRQLKSMSDGTITWNYTYNADGMRTSRSDGSNTYEYIYDGTRLSRMVKRENGEVSVFDFIYDAEGVMGVLVNAFNRYTYVRNLQGDIIGILDAQGTAVVQYTYDAWGNIICIEGSEKDGLGVDNPLRYRGYVYDEETGFYYVSSRYYDPEIGRFINADDIDYLGADGSPLSYNLFAYCMNNPVNRFDVNGNWSLPNWAKIAIGAAAIAVGVIATAATGGAAAPVLVASLKIAATSAAIGAVSGAGISAVNHRVSTGSWEGAGKAAVTGAIDGACDGFMWGGITAGASFTTVAAKGIKVKEIGKLKPSNKPGDGYSGVKYQAPKANGKYTTRSIELHSPHKSGPHNVWHWQQNTWNPYNNSITGSAKHWTIWGKPL